jgi:hypothetical protein
MMTAMRRWIFCSLGLICVAVAALWSAQNKMHDYSVLSPLRVGLSENQLAFLGQPASLTARERIYVLPDQSNLIVTLHDGVVFSAWLELKSPLKIQDPSLRHLTFVQMGMDDSQARSWFYAAAPGEGRIFKVSDQGFIQTITWVKPFANGGAGRNLQALLREFETQSPYRL